MFSNSEKVTKELLNEKDDRLLLHLLDAGDVEKMLRIAYQQVLGRPPEREELKVLREYLEKRSDRPAEALRQALWAMISGTEFRFTY